MAEPKTQPTGASVEEFLAGVDEARQADCRTILEILERASGEPPAMWGPSIVGFGTYRYRYASGREGDWPLVGFSPRKQNLTIYIMAGFRRYQELMAKIGKHKTGSSCLYVRKLADIDLEVLEELARASCEHLRARSA